MDVHIGKLISKRLDQVGMTKSEFARRLHLRGQSITPMLRKKSINTAQLQEISNILDYDFFQHYQTVKPQKEIDEQPNIKMTTPKMSIMITIDDEEKQDRVLRVLGISLK